MRLRARQLSQDDSQRVWWVGFESAHLSGFRGHGAGELSFPGESRAGLVEAPAGVGRPSGARASALWAEQECRAAWVPGTSKE